MQNVQLVYHDDWLVNVLLSDGRVYTFNTELWPEHTEETALNGSTRDQDWIGVIEVAKSTAVRLAEQRADTWGLDAIPDTIEQFRKGMDLVSRYTSDQDFRKFIR